ARRCAGRAGLPAPAAARRDRTARAPATLPAPRSPPRPRRRRRRRPRAEPPRAPPRWRARAPSDSRSELSPPGRWLGVRARPGPGATGGRAWRGTSTPPPLLRRLRGRHATAELDIELLDRMPRTGERMAGADDPPDADGERGPAHHERRVVDQAP